MLECLGPLLILIGLVMAFYALVLRPTVLGDRWHAPLKHLAQKFHGLYESGGWFGTPRVRMRDGTGGILIEMRTQNHGRPLCCVLLDLPGLQLTAQIVGEPMTAREHRPAADSVSNFTLYTAQTEQGQALLSDGVRWILTQLQHTPERSDLFVELSGGKLLVRKPWYSSKLADWDRYLGLTIGLRDQMLLAGSQAIAFDANSGQVAFHEAKCPFCGEVTVDEVVLCRACHTPHHRECWEANTGCSMYGCKESRYLVPHAQAPLPVRRPNKPR